MYREPFCSPCSYSVCVIRVRAVSGDFSLALTSADCTACPAHSTAPDVGSDSCTCAVNYYGDGKTYCNACPSHSTSDAGSSVCTCAANYYYVDATMTCQACPAGYSSNAGSTDASDCMAPPSSSSSLSGGAIAGIVIAVVVGIATGGAAFFYYDKMARDKMRFMEEVHANSASASNPMQQKNVV